VKKIYILFYLLILFSNGKAQMATLFSEELSGLSNTRVGTTSDYFVNASSLTTTFINKFYTGGYIDAALKDRVRNKTKNSNQLGAELNYGIFAAFKPDSLFHKNVLNLFFSVRDRFHMDAHFPKDFYNVGFYGNAEYAGGIADLSDFSLNILRYQQFQIGIFSSKLDSNARWGIGLSFLKGEHYYSVLARKAMLFTSTDGQYVDFDTDIEMAQSNPSNKGLKAVNGYGASMDIYFEAPFQTYFGPSKLAVSVADIGLIRFNDKSLYRKQDSLFHYTGFQVKSIFDLQDSTFLKTSQNSIQNKILPSKKRSVTTTLPSTLNLSFESTVNKHFHLTEGVHYIFNANYKLLAYIRGNVYLNKNVMISATIGYGGYAGFNCGIGLGANLGAGFSLYAGSNNLEGYLFPSKTSGRAAYFSIIKNFNLKHYVTKINTGN
jgi:hypothetical protein